MFKAKIILLILLLSACSIYDDFDIQIDPADLKEQIKYLEAFNLGEKEYCSTIEYWVLNEIEYIQDIDNQGILDYWQTPEETYSLMSGDCEDRAILWAYFVERYYGPGAMVILTYSELNDKWHMSGKYNDYWFSRFEDFKIVKIYSLEEALIVSKYLR